MPVTMDIKKALETAGGEQELERKLRRFGGDVRYLQSIRQDLLRQYVDHWVAVYEASVAAHAKTAEELQKQLLEKGIPVNEAVVDFIASERKAMLL